MNSWNRSTSYSRNVKLYNIGLTKEQLNKAYDMLYVDGFYNYINSLIEDFDSLHDHQYQVGFNRRSSGYMVLYQGGQKPSGYVSHCTKCYQRNYAKVLPKAKTPQDIVRNFVRCKNHWIETVYPGQPEIQTLGLPEEEVIALVKEVKAELKRTETKYTENNKCGRCNQFTRVNDTTVHMQRYTQPGLGMDEDPDFAEWEDYSLKQRYDLIKDFDALVDDCIANVKYMADNFVVAEEVIQCEKTVKVLQPVEVTA